MAIIITKFHINLLSRHFYFMVSKYLKYAAAYSFDSVFSHSTNWVIFKFKNPFQKCKEHIKKNVCIKYTQWDQWDGSVGKDACHQA